MCKHLRETHRLQHQRVIRGRKRVGGTGMLDSAMPVANSNSLPTARDFMKLSRKHSLVPVYRTVTADLETPVSAFLRIASAEPEAFLLESVEGGEHVGRYTFIGIQPYKKIVSRGTHITVQDG